MHSSQPALLTVFVLGVVLSFVGCGAKGGGGGGAAESSPRERELKEIFDVYKTYFDQHKKGPASLADIKGFVTVFPEAIQALRGGQCVVYWGADLKAGDVASAVLGYEKKVATEGGLVLMKNGTTKTMTAAEFQAAPKAGR